MKKVCIVCYSFPPDNRVSSLRPYKIARAFHESGWAVTVCRSSFTGASPSSPVPVEFASVTSYNPCLLSRVLAENFYKSFPYPWSSLILFVQKIIRRLILPEHTWLLIGPAWKHLLSLYVAEKFDCVITTSFPFSLHMVGLLLKKAFPGIVWVADNRDPWSFNEYRKFTFTPKIIERDIEKKVFSQCDIASFASASALEIYSRFFKIKQSVEALNGFVADLDYPAKEAARAPVVAAQRRVYRLVHAGGLYNGKRIVSPLIDALKSIASVQAVQFNVDLYGAGSGLSRLLEESSAGLTIKIHPRVSRNLALQVQGEADYLVVAMGRTEYEKTYVPAKIFEAAALQKPVIALCDPASDLALIVKKYELGIASFDAHEIAEFIESSMLDEWCPSKSSLKRQELSYSFQFNRIVYAVEALVGKPVFRGG